MRIEKRLKPAGCRGAWRAGAVLIAAACAGCAAVGPDPHEPETDVPGGWSQAAQRAFAAEAKSRAVAAAFDGQRWWQVFQDPTLDRLERLAAAQNFDLQSAVLRIEIARAQRDAAVGARYPNVAATGIGLRTRQSRNGISQALGGGSSAGGMDGSGTGGSGAAGGSGGKPSSTFNLFDVGFDATWEPDLFGKVRRSVQAADADVRAAEAARYGALVSLTAEIARTYLELRGNQRQREIASTDLATQKRLLRLIESRNRSGLAPMSEVVTQRAQTSAARAQLPPLEQAIALARNRLALLLARPPGGVDELLGAASLPPLPPEVPVGLPGELLRRRPDIRQREAQLEAATARIGVATASLYPSVTLGLAAGLQATRAADLFDWASRFFIGGLQVSVPIFEGGRLRAQVRIADLQAQQAVLGYRQTVLGAFHDVDNALVAYAQSQARAREQAAQVGDATRSRELAEDRYRNGLAAYIDVLDAERRANEARVALARSNVAATTNLVALFKALGGGWGEAGAGTTAASSQQ